VTKETVAAPTTREPIPAKQPGEREKAQPVVTAPVAPKELKHEPKPAVERNVNPNAQRGNQPGIQRDANSEMRQEEKPVKGRGAEKQIKGAKETSKGKSAEKGKKKKDQEPETPPEKPAGSP